MIKDYLLSFLKFILVYLTPVFPIMIVIGVVVLADTYYGRKAARARKEKVTSKNTRAGLIPKMLGYQIAIITLFIIDVWAVNEIVINYVPFTYMLTKIAGSFIIWIEWTSINESYEDIHGYTLNSKIGEYSKLVRTTIGKLLDFKKDVKDKNK
jgi:hypothetical protein